MPQRLGKQTVAKIEIVAQAKQVVEAAGGLTWEVRIWRKGLARSAPARNWAISALDWTKDNIVRSLLTLSSEWTGRTAELPKGLWHDVAWKIADVVLPPAQHPYNNA